MRSITLFFGAVMLLAAPAAYADPVPPPVEAMIREAAKNPDTLKTIVTVAKATNPQSTAEIDQLVDSLKAEAEAAHREKLAHGGIFDNWSGSGSVGVNKTTGNTRDTEFTAGLALTKDGLKFRHKLNAQVDHETASGVLTRNRYLANYELDYKFNDRLYAFGQGGWEKDTFAGFTHRLSESVGLGYTVFKTKTMNLDVSAGPALRQTRFVTGRTDHETTAQAALDYAWKLRDNLTFSEKAAIFVNSSITSTTALTTSISKAFSARVSFDFIHENKVPLGHVPDDTATRFSLVYGF